jgi:hypothetical protein
MTIREMLTRLCVLTSPPAALATVTIFAVLWWIFSPLTLDWHAFASALDVRYDILHPAQSIRDTQGHHAMLDELLRGKARAQCGDLDRWR